MTRQVKHTEEEFLRKIAEHQRIIHKVCHMFSKDEQDREDLFQEITIRLWLGYQSFKGDASFTTWMYRVALNTAISLKRKNRNHEQTQALPPNLDAPEEPNAITRQDIDMLYKAIEQLNPVDRALVLLYLEEKSYEEIADIMGITKTNVGVKLVRIKKKLETLIRHYE